MESEHFISQLKEEKPKEYQMNLKGDELSQKPYKLFEIVL